MMSSLTENTDVSAWGRYAGSSLITCHKVFVGDKIPRGYRRAGVKMALMAVRPSGPIAKYRTRAGMWSDVSWLTVDL
jgi:hypothetical protein